MIRSQLSLIGPPVELDVSGIAATQVPRDNPKWADHWHTPPEILAMVIEVFGGPIDLDPCTDESNPTGALKPFFQPKRDGLKDRWYGQNCFFNPPFSNKPAWLEKAAFEGRLKRPQIGICPGAVLHNKGTRDAVSTATAIAPVGRVKFIASTRLQQYRESLGKDPDPGSPVDDMALLYWGDDPERFARVVRSAGFWAYPGAQKFRRIAA